MSNSGYFLAFRSVWRHPAFKSVIESAIWLYIVSNASHKDKELKFMENPIFVKRGELIFPLRKNAKIWGITYPRMRLFIQRLKTKKMINIRLATMNPHRDHKYAKVSIISVVNYDKFQQYDLTPNQYKTTTNALLNNKLNNNTNISKDKKDVNSGNNYDGSYKVVSTWGDEDIVEKNGKKYVRHRWKGTIKPLEK
tara:strand:+ start:1433 stop:2017 length:585 start_codon:yes stop_codon:yes gene_type:complete